jgi:hypothetical protein
MSTSSASPVLALQATPDLLAEPQERAPAVGQLPITPRAEVLGLSPRRRSGRIE